MLWKKKIKDDKPDSKIILGMIMLNDIDPFNLDNLVEDYNSTYDNEIQESLGDNSSAVLTIAGQTVIVGHIPTPIPSGDIEGTAEYAYNWVNALNDTKDHKSHLIISVMGSKQNQIARFKIFTQVLCSLLRTTNAIGVYKGNQSILVPKVDYLKEASRMTDDYLPLNLWIYFGLQTNDKGNSGYTYGLKEFGKTEMEILNSSKDLEDIRGFLFNMTHYVLDYDVAFKSGQTCGLSADEKIKITLSKGKLAEGDTFKFAY
ncbi:DUF4261 domain-containing protein [Pinibacter soli]|uniref:DUF4261 domain-containing protein n=1 Tax=Pinibacter soli TaxID=3044211 RepID=A0ABT6RJI3_9BACT|nr:DUF4261 domain-containing protein [Pinibacter soli]MDI3322730.1 DUF4261 domain-containing protein [Pinibacter soli]